MLFRQNLRQQWGRPVTIVGSKGGPTLPQVLQGVVSAINQSPVNPNLGFPAQSNVKKPSDQRFRSFAERYIIARAHHFRVPMNEHAEDQWACIQDAKRCYAMIERVGRNIEPEEDTF